MIRIATLTRAALLAAMGIGLGGCGPTALTSVPAAPGFHVQCDTPQPVCTPSPDCDKPSTVANFGNVNVINVGGGGDDDPPDRAVNFGNVNVIDLRNWPGFAAWFHH